MEDMFKQMSDVGTGLSQTRVSAMNVTEVRRLVGERQLYVRNAKVGGRDEKPPGPNQYSFQEAAATLSHLAAILHAYNEGHESVLVLEDNVEFYLELEILCESCSQKLEHSPVAYNQRLNHKSESDGFLGFMAARPLFSASLHGIQSGYAPDS
jgi:GR25 family glycosyltransferase involved in LPS biosynthesis